MDLGAKEGKGVNLGPTAELKIIVVVVSTGNPTVRHKSGMTQMVPTFLDFKMYIAFIMKYGFHCGLGSKRTTMFAIPRAL